MRYMKPIFLVIALFLGLPAQAAQLTVPFKNIDGGELRISDWAGSPVLVVNTASRCGFTRQYADMQKLYDSYRTRGLVVLAVPSDDFNQELDSNAEVKEFCEIQYGLDFPMTGITSVRGENAHPFFKSVAAEANFVPGWNFNKILIGPNGNILGTWGSMVSPTSTGITRKIETHLPK